MGLVPDMPDWDPCFWFGNLWIDHLYGWFMELTELGIYHVLYLLIFWFVWWSLDEILANCGFGSCGLINCKWRLRENSHLVLHLKPPPRRLRQLLLRKERRKFTPWQDRSMILLKRLMFTFNLLFTKLVLFSCNWSFVSACFRQREPLRIFYESLSKQIPSSEMAEFWWVFVTVMEFLFYKFVSFSSFLEK